MSPDNAKTGEPSRYLNGEGCKEKAEKQSEPSHRSGGVSADGMQGNDGRVRQETCGGVRLRRTTAGTSRASGKAGVAVAGVGDLHSSEEARESITRAERREGTCSNAHKRSEGLAMAGDESLWTKTPPKIRKLQIALYRKAKANPRWRVYSLYGDLMRPEVLREAIKRVVANKGASGVDGYKVERLKDEAEVERFIAELQQELRSRSYKPTPVRRVYIDKGNGKKRPLGIPTVKDRILQTAVAMFLLPVWEADQHDNSYAYRPNRRTTQAVDAIKSALFGGRVEVIDVDIAGYFDTIPHAGLMKQVARRVSDGSILKLIKMWLRAPISEYDSKTGKTKILPNKRGIPQGGVISPLLANLYLSPLDYAVNGKCKEKPSMIRYADDLVILCAKGQGKELLERLRKWLKAKELKLNEEKTRLVNAWEEGFNFVGFAITRRESRRGRNYYHVEPGIKSRNRLKAAIREVLNVQTRNCDEAQTVKKVNEITRGWAQAFYYGNNCRVFGSMQKYARQRLRDWLWRRHSKTRGRYTHYTNERLHGRYGLWKWPTKAAWAAA